MKYQVLPILDDKVDNICRATDSYMLMFTKK
jgi:hypothetical protein